MLAVILMLQCSCYATLSKKDRKTVKKGSTKPPKPGKEVRSVYLSIYIQCLSNSITNILVPGVLVPAHVYGYLVYSIWYLYMGTWCISICVWVPGVLALHVYRLCCNQLHRFLIKDWLQRQPSGRTLSTTITFGIKMALTAAACQSIH